jgi:hypothetical protein
MFSDIHLYLVSIMLLLNLYEAQHQKSTGGYYGLFSRSVDCITNAILIRFVEYMNIDCAVLNVLTLHNHVVS